LVHFCVYSTKRLSCTVLECWDEIVDNTNAGFKTNKETGNQSWQWRFITSSQSQHSLATDTKVAIATADECYCWQFDTCK